MSYLSHIYKLWYITRSICGEGLRTSIQYFVKRNPELKFLSFRSGLKLSGGWVVPQEWDLDCAYIEHESGVRYCCTETSNLSVVNFSHPVDLKLFYHQLIKHLHYIKEQPCSIPYVTSYYKRTWGFLYCLLLV